MQPVIDREHSNSLRGSLEPFPRRTASPHRLAVWLSLASCLSLSLPLSPSATRVAFAQEDDPLKRSAARDLAIQGAEAYDAGDFSTALDRFTRASALVSAPTLLVMQARSFLALGRWLE